MHQPHRWHDVKKYNAATTSGDNPHIDDAMVEKLQAMQHCELLQVASEYL